MNLKEAMAIIKAQGTKADAQTYQATVVVLNALDTALVTMDYFCTESVAIKNALQRMKNENKDA